MLNAPGIIDADYRGDIGVILINLGDRPFTVNHGDRIAQIVFQCAMRAVFIPATGLQPTERGDGLLQHAIRRTMLIAEQAGIRAMLTHPIDEEAARVYTRFGFIASPLREQQLLFLLKDARKVVQ